MKNQELQNALDLIGGLSKPSKMPCPSYSLPASGCHIGAKLRKVKGSVCEKCYACKGNYLYPVVKNCLEKRLASITKDGWTDAFVYIITEKKISYLRLHDSGDLQSLGHLEKIVEIARRCPSCKIWLPTKENSIVLQYLKIHGAFPENLTVRLSCVMLDGENLAVKNLAAKNGLCVASVSKDMAKVNCHAYKTNGKCGECRACWDKSVFEIVYKRH